MSDPLKFSIEALSKSKIRPNAFKRFLSKLRLNASIHGVKGTQEDHAAIVEITPSSNKISPIADLKQAISDAIFCELLGPNYTIKASMTCQSCAAAIEKNLADKVENLQIDVLEKTVSFTCNKQFDFLTVKNSIYDAGFDVTVMHGVSVQYLDPTKTQLLDGSIMGLREQKDAKQIRDYILKNVPECTQCEVMFATYHVKIQYLIHPASKTGFSKTNNDLRMVNKINSVLQNYSKDKNIRIQYSQPVDEKNADNALQEYFQFGGINALCGILLVLFSGYIPLPITVAGQWVGLCIGALTFNVMWFTAKDVYADAWRKLIKKESPNMNTLIALGTFSAWLYSIMLCLFPTIFPPSALLQFHFLAVNMILGIVNFGKGVRQVAQEEANRQLKALKQTYRELQPAIAQKVINNKNATDVSIVQVKAGDRLIVKLGQCFPVDCTVITPNVKIHLSQDVLTGETKRTKKTNERVFAGAMLDKIERLTGSPHKSEKLIVQADCDGNKSSLNTILEQVQKAATSNKSSKQTSIDKIAAVFVPTILSIAGISGLTWLAVGPQPAFPWMLQSMMSVLLCACPCALGLAAPIAMRIGIYKLLDKKALVRTPEAIEKLTKVDTFVFDKTGTLTVPTLCESANQYDPEYSERTVLSMVASLEREFKDHPLADVLSRIGMDQELDEYDCRETQREVGTGPGAAGGVSGIINGKKVYIGNSLLMKNNQIKTDAFDEKCKENDEASRTSIFVAIDGKCVGILGLEHQIRPDAKAAVKYLMKRGIDVFICTGDSEASAQQVACELELPTDRKIGAIYTDNSPAQKAKLIADMQLQKRTVAMVGDGVNDLQAIGKADVSIALGSWTHAATSSDLALQRLNLHELFSIADETVKTIDQNLKWALIYNVISIVAASGLLYPLYGIVLNPVVASLSMAFSSIFVVFNSTLLAAKIDNKLAPSNPKSTYRESLSSIFVLLKKYAKTIGSVFIPSLRDDMTSSPQAALRSLSPSPEPYRTFSTGDPPKVWQRKSAELNRLSQSAAARGGAVLTGQLDEPPSSPDVGNAPTPR